MKPPTIVPIYWVLYPLIVEAARAHGYAIAVHGSLQRDLDLVAVPWTDRAVDQRTLVLAVADAVGGWLHPEEGPSNPVLKPHGRQGWTIHIDQHAYIDLSVMPTHEEARIVADERYDKFSEDALDLGDDVDRDNDE